MSQVSSLPDYIEFVTQLQETLPNSHPSQLHGLICGAVCVTAGRPADNLWENFLPRIKKTKKATTYLFSLYESTYHYLSEFSFEFQLLLPDDESDINIRAEALGLWCQGFLTALDKVDASIREQYTPEMKEASDDMVEIAKINYGDIATNEEDETAYFELVEYVRLTVQLIFQELKPAPIKTEDNVNIH